MTSVITGDIIKSREQTNPEVWLQPLKQALSSLATDDKYWEIYRGDSFQIEVKDYLNSFTTVLYIKACIKMIKGLDVRLAIGLGDKTYDGAKVTEANGEAFVFSGEAFEALKKEKQNLLIKTANKTLNKELNLYFKLASISMDNWTTNSAEVVKLSIEYPKAVQAELAKHINTNQNAISKRQKRANLDELLELDLMYRAKLSQLT